MAQPQPQFIDVDDQNIASRLNEAQAASDTAWYRVAFAAANAVAPANTGGDYVVATYTVPANAFGSGKQQVQDIYISVAGKFAANNNSKRVKIIAGATNPVVGQAVSGGTVVADSGAQTTGANTGGFLLQTQILRVDASHQIAVVDGLIANVTHLGTAAPVDLTFADGAAITIAVTINNVTNASDASLQYFEVDALA